MIDELLRRRSASLRHLLWSFAIAGLVMVPVLTRIAPQWRVLPAATRPIAWCCDAAIARA